MGRSHSSNASRRQRFGLSPTTLRVLINADPPRLKAVKMGRDWFVTPKDVKAYLAARRPVGRPPKEGK